MNVVRKLAVHILEKIQEHLIILPNMIVASILLQNPTGINRGRYGRASFYHLSHEGSSNALMCTLIFKQSC
jgi:hypothetical protein